MAIFGGEKLGVEEEIRFHHRHSLQTAPGSTRPHPATRRLASTSTRHQRPFPAQTKGRPFPAKTGKGGETYTELLESPVVLGSSSLTEIRGAAGEA